MTVDLQNKISSMTMQTPTDRHETIRDLFAKIHENRTNNPLKNLKRFPGVVMAVMPYDDPSADKKKQDSAGLYVICVVRPIIHNWLVPWPCQPAFKNNQGLVDKILSEHPIARSTEVIGMGKSIVLTPGTRINCYRADGKKGPWRFDFSKISSPDGNYQFECLRGENSTFSNGDLLGTGTGGGEPPLGQTNYQPKRKWVASKSSKEDGTFTKGKCPEALERSYSNLPRNTTTFYYYDKNQIKSLIKSSGAPVDIQKTMWCFISKEQPFKNKGGLAMYPNNNPAGIQTDGGRVNGSKFVEYQTCFKDADTWRAFAGFSTVENGFKTLQSMVSSKYLSKKRPWMKPAGSIRKQAEILTVNYYTNWNTKATTAEIEQLKKNNNFVRDGKSYGNWNGTVAQFESFLKEWSS